MKEFKTGDLVFAKLRGYAPWPARIENVTAAPQGAVRYHIFFYVSGKRAVMKGGDLFAYEEHKASFAAQYKQKTYQVALEVARGSASKQVEQSINKNVDSTPQEPLFVEPAQPTPTVKPKRKPGRPAKQSIISEKQTLSSSPETLRNVKLENADPQSNQRSRSSSKQTNQQTNIPRVSFSHPLEMPNYFSEDSDSDAVPISTYRNAKSHQRPTPSTEELGKDSENQIRNPPKNNDNCRRSPRVVQSETPVTDVSGGVSSPLPHKRPRDLEMNGTSNKRRNLAFSKDSECQTAGEQQKQPEEGNGDDEEEETVENEGTGREKQQEQPATKRTEREHGVVICGQCSKNFANQDALNNHCLTSSCYLVLSNDVHPLSGSVDAERENLGSPQVEIVGGDRDGRELKKAQAPSANVASVPVGRSTEGGSGKRDPISSDVYELRTPPTHAAYLNHHGRRLHGGSQSPYCSHAECRPRPGMDINCPCGVQMRSHFPTGEYFSPNSRKAQDLRHVCHNPATCHVNICSGACCGSWGNVQKQVAQHHRYDKYNEEGVAQSFWLCYRCDRIFRCERIFTNHHCIPPKESNMFHKPSQHEVIKIDDDDLETPQDV